jgi:putative toxin-antitoxin system antitoxin component (TIGR02293 family)
MALSVAREVVAKPPQPAASLAEWMRALNQLADQAGRAGKQHIGPARSKAATGPRNPRNPLMLAGSTGTREKGSDAATEHAALGYRMAPDVAEHLAVDGLDPDFLGDLAACSGLDPRDLLDFAGIDRTTVSRRKASGAALPQDAAVKALQAADLVTQATEVFDSPLLASTWLTKPHPSLDGDTPLRRARTPWGLSKVQSILVALRYGGVT